MTDFARTRKQAAFGALFVGLSVGLLIVGALWRRSEQETLRAEAAKLLALGQLQAERHPSGALAYALKSLELADTPEARLFAVELLQAGPVARRTRGYLVGDPPETVFETMDAAFSPNGEWLAIGGYRKAELLRPDGGEPLLIHGEYPSSGHRSLEVGFSSDGRTLVTNRWGDVRLWSVPNGSLIRETGLEAGPS